MLTIPLPRFASKASYVINLELWFDACFKTPEGVFPHPIGTILPATPKICTGTREEHLLWCRSCLTSGGPGCQCCPGSRQASSAREGEKEVLVSMGLDRRSALATVAAECHTPAMPSPVRVPLLDGVRVPAQSVCRTGGAEIPQFQLLPKCPLTPRLHAQRGSSVAGPLTSLPPSPPLQAERLRNPEPKPHILPPNIATHTTVDKHMDSN